MLSKRWLKFKIQFKIGVMGGMFTIPLEVNVIVCGLGINVRLNELVKQIKREI